MEFWGVEVKSGESLKVKSGGSFGLHLSQASLGEFQKEKGNESVCLYVTIGDQKLVLGILSPQKFPQLSFDLVFNEDFELSHNWKSGSVYFLGYRGPNGTSGTSSEGEDESEEDLPITADNGKPKSEAKQAKPIAENTSNVTTVKSDSTVTKQKVKIVEASKDAKSDEEHDDSVDEEDNSLSDDQAVSDDEDEDDDGSDEVEDESDDADEKMQKKAEMGKKRTTDSAMKGPFSNKKAKLVTPQKTDGKKAVVHVPTPYPSKPAVKTSGNSSQNKGQSPKTFACKSCSRSFGSENALQSHTKAKHSAAP